MSHLLIYFFLLLNQNYSTFIVESGKDIKLFWKDDKGEIYGGFDRLKDKVVFAMNAGAYDENQHPIGLYIEDGKKIKPLNPGRDKSNFSTKPNGVFYVTNDGIAGIAVTEKFSPTNVKYANQSGPMLVIDGDISHSVKQKTTSYYIRNGVGILKDGTVIFAISKKKVTMKEFAEYFVSIGSVSALYWDGGVSQAYPFKTNDRQHFGVIVGVTK